MGGLVSRSVHGFPNPPPLLETSQGFRLIKAYSKLIMGTLWWDVVGW